MNRVIYLTLMCLLLAPMTVFAQMGGEVHYSQMWLDDSEADPPDGGPGRIYIAGAATTQDGGNPYNHSYRATVSLWGSNGQSVYGDGGASMLWNGVGGGFSLSSTHTTSCPICGCEWENYTGEEMAATPLGYTELYYKFDRIISQIVDIKNCGYLICDWSRNCECFNFLRQTAIITCACETPCAIGAVVKYKITRWSIPIIGERDICVRLGLTQPLTFDPCVAVPPWDPNCGITAEPKPFP